MSETTMRGAMTVTRPVNDRVALAAMILFSLLVAAALTLSRIETVWRTGAFFDSDDAMRAVQLRDLLAGQPWFDLTAHRVDPPYGLPMHWSRIVDLPLAALNLLFATFLAPEYAERATRLVFPFALMGALFALVAWLSTILAKPASRFAVIWLTLLSGVMFLQFAPGRIDHHAPQIVTLAAALGFFLQGLDPVRAPRLAIAATLMALSVTISLENLPFFIVMIAALPLLLIVDGGDAGRRLFWFSAGALVAFPALYVATVPASSYFASACDAYSFVHLVTILIGAVSIIALGLFAKRLETPRNRLLAVFFCGALMLAIIEVLAPHCLGDPLGGLDPLLRDLWLSHVAEAKPLLSLYATSPNVVIATIAPVALGLLAALGFAWSSQGVARRRWLVLAACVCVGLAAGLWQTRVFTSVTPLAMVALGAAILVFVEKLAADSGLLLRAALIVALGALVSPIGLALALPAQTDAEGAERGCLAPAALAPLADYPASRVVSSFDLGAHILVHTPHSVFAAPYHRDNHGNRIAADAFLATPDKAEALLRQAGAEIVVWCLPTKPLPSLATASPNGLAALLAKGAAPDWLIRKSPAGAPLQIFALRPAQ